MIPTMWDGFGVHAWHSAGVEGRGRLPGIGSLLPLWDPEMELRSSALCSKSFNQ